MDLVCCVLGGVTSAGPKGTAFVHTRTPECVQNCMTVDKSASKIAAESADKSLCGDETVRYSTHLAKKVVVQRVAATSHSAVNQ